MADEVRRNLQRIAVWGSSFGGGHSITVASRHPELLAAASQCPFTDGLASARALGPAASLKELKARCSECLSGYKRPKSIRVVESLPKNAVGKLDKMSLRDALARSA